MSNKKQSNLSAYEEHYYDHEMDMNHDIIDQVIAAIDRGDKEEEARLTPLVKIDPMSANSLKSIYGLKRFIDMGFNMDRVVAKYGKEWFEKESDDYIDMTDTWAKVTKMQEEIKAKKMKK